MKTPFPRTPTLRIGIPPNLIEHFCQYGPIRSVAQGHPARIISAVFRTPKGTYGIPGSARVKLRMSMMQDMLVTASSESNVRLPEGWDESLLPSQGRGRT